MKKTVAMCWTLMLLVAILCESVTCKGGRGGARGSARGTARGRFRSSRARARPRYPSRSRSFGSPARLAVAGAAAGAAAGLAAGVMAGNMQRSRLTWDVFAQRYVDKNCPSDRNCSSEVYGSSSALSSWPDYSLPSMFIVFTFQCSHL